MTSLIHSHSMCPEADTGIRWDVSPALPRPLSTPPVNWLKVEVLLCLLWAETLTTGRFAWCWNLSGRNAGSTVDSGQADTHRALWRKHGGRFQELNSLDEGFRNVLAGCKVARAAKRVPQQSSSSPNLLGCISPLRSPQADDVKGEERRPLLFLAR
ncbi:hypothetical protein Q5P01_019159 [Channa striata]|uniref:Uncharacterized protein n=1 Tax=Channa striata TaxID=64152 RepID=A0AA88M0Z4_CHASR|nr:hypothetical protein Q5P01_019159 [Channa striata]